MDLIKLNNYTPPAPSAYNVEYSDVNGEKSQVEDGTTYIEQVRADVPTISLEWKNLTQDDVTAISREVSNDVISVEYFYGDMKSAEMTASARALKLKAIDSSGNSYCCIV